MLFIGLVFGCIGYGQNIEKIIPSTPKAASFDPISSMNLGIPSNTVAPSTIQFSLYDQAQKSKRQLAQYEKDRKAIEEQEKVLNDLYRDVGKSMLTVNYAFPNSRARGARYYDQALDALLAINPDDYSIKEATFIIENAFYENTKNFDEFDGIIKNTGSFIREAIKQQGFDMENDLTKNLTIYQYITDTLTVNGKTHYPYTYDFDDYMGKESWDNMFVHKLMYEASGQCNSMPRYYLIIAEELGANADLAFAPNHSFIKFKDGKGDWYNAELTSGALMADALMLSSGYIKAETVGNGNYMVAQSKRQVMAQLLNDLASGYISKYGIDGFVEKVINESLELNPNGINGNLLKLNYQLALMSYVASQLKAQHPSQLRPYPKAMAIFSDLVEQDRRLKEIGFEEMPKERYEAWLKSMEEENEKQEQRELLRGFKRTMTIKRPGNE